MLKEGDITLTCRQCGKEFVFTSAEQEFYQVKGFAVPQRCRECRSTRKEHSDHLLCAQCGIELGREAAVYCSRCLENAQLELELKTGKTKKAASEAYAKLKAVETEKKELVELLQKREQEIAELERQFENVSQDLEKAVQFHAALGWLEPKLGDIEERLKDLEQGQNKVNERMLQLVQRVHELHESSTLLEVVKRSLKHWQGQSHQTT